MPKLPLTSGQEAFIDNLLLQNTDNRAIEVVKATMRYRNTLAPSGAMYRNEAAQDMLELIDRVS